jgi:phosphonate degradation associated HDIG domain protein
MTQQEAAQIVKEIIALYEEYGDADYIGEPVSQLEHMCQCAQLAEEEGYDTEVILAAFMHDIGHLCGNLLSAAEMNGFGIVDHEKLGEVYIRSKGFSEKISKLVGSHVSSKRYLTFKYPEYYEKLSPASKQTLVMQGGMMTEEEANVFEEEELFHLYITLRRWDEEAKKENMPLASLQHYRRLMEEHLITQ